MGDAQQTIDEPQHDLRHRLPPGPPPRVMVASGVDAEKMAFNKLLGDVGCKVGTCPPEDAMRLCHDDPPEVLILDGTLAREKLGTCVRVLGKNPDTRGVVVVLLAPADRNVAERLRMLDAFCVMQRPLTTAKIYREVGRAVRWAAELREMFGLKGGKAQALASRVVPGCDALLVRPVGCPMHDEPITADRHVLRGGRLAGEPDAADISTYTHALRGGDFVDFNTCNVTVCPRCLFASTRGPDFIDLKDPSKSPARELFTPDVVRAVQEQQPDREAIVGQPSRSFFSHERTPEEAVISHRLAAASALTLYRANPERLTNYACVAADAHLTISLLNESADRGPDPAELTSARDLLNEARPLLADGPMLRALYQVAAIEIRLGDDAASYQAMRQLDELSRKLADPQLDAAASRYLGRIKQLWGDRDYHRVAA